MTTFARWAYIPYLIWFLYKVSKYATLYGNYIGIKIKISQLGLLFWSKFSELHCLKVTYLLLLWIVIIIGANDLCTLFLINTFNEAI